MSSLAAGISSRARFRSATVWPRIRSARTSTIGMRRSAGDPHRHPADVPTPARAGVLLWLARRWRNAEVSPWHAASAREPDNAPSRDPVPASQSASDVADQPRYAVLPLPRPRIWSHGWNARGQPFGALFREGRGPMSGVATAVVAAITIGTLYFGREVFVPIALAILLSFVLAPLVRLLQRWRLPRGLSVVGVVLLAFVSIFALGGVIATQVTELAGDLPRYQFTMREKIKSLRGTAAPSGTLERAADVLHDLGKELNKPKGPAVAPPASLQTPAPEARPIPVEVRQPPPTALESIAALISPLLHPLTTTGIIAIFVIFILLQREDLRNRFIKLAGSHDLQKTTAALDDAATRLSRLFLIQLAVNAAFGIVIGAGLWIIGVPSPILWGILAAILRFVPYIGAVIAAVFPLTLAAAVDPGWSMLLWTPPLFVVV